MNTRVILPLATGLLSLALLSACAPIQMATNCTAASPKKGVKISYGDSELSIKDKTQRAKKVKRNDYILFELDPDSDKGPGNLDYKTVTVTIEGKDKMSSWLAASGTEQANSDGLLVCVPSYVDNNNKTYSYNIRVDQVGVLDPRIIVEP